MTVTATEKGDGTIETKIDKAAADVVFENDVEDTYDNPDEEHTGRRHEHREGDAEATPKATKTLLAADGSPVSAAEGAFEFELLIDGEVVDTATNAADGSVTFRPLYYGWETIGKTYEYTIREVVPASAKKGADGTYVSNGIAYDTHEESWTVTVGADEGDNVVLTESYGTEGGATFTNKRTGVSTEVVPTATKKFVDSDGKAVALRSGEFEFRLLDADGEAVATVKNKANGSVTFPLMSYTADDAGKTFEYTIEEVIPDGTTEDGKGNYVKNDVTYDGHSVKYTVKVSLDKSGTKLTATGTYSEDDGATFTNVKKATKKSEKKETKKSKLAKTSDLASPLLPQLTMLGSALLGGGVVLKRRKRRRD